MSKFFGSAFCVLLFSCVLAGKVEFLENPIIGSYLYFNKVAGFSAIIFSIFFLFNSTKFNIKFGLIELFLIVFFLYIFLHAITFKTPFIPQFYSQIFLLILVFIGKYYFTIQAKLLPISLSIFMCFGIYESILGVEYLYSNPHLLGIFQPKGTFPNSGPYAIYLSVHFVLAFTVILNFKKGNEIFNKILLGISILNLTIAGFILPFTTSRTAWLASICGIVFIIFQKYNFLKKLKNGFKSKFAKLVLIGTIAFLVFLQFRQVYKFKQNSADGRLLIWKVSILMAKDAPVFGKGFNYFPKFYDNYQAKYFSEPRTEKEQYLAGKNYSAFNDYIKIFVEYGVFGFILFGLIIFLVFYKNTSIYLGVFITCCIACVSSYTLETIPTQLNFYFILMLCTITINPTKQFELPNKFNKYIIFSILVIAFYIIIKSFELEKIEKQCFLAEQDFNQENYDSTINKYEKLFESIKTDGSKLMIYGKALALKGNHLKAIEIYKLAQKHIADPFLCNNFGLSLQVNKNWKQAEYQFELSSRMVPNLIYPKYLLANLYIEKKDIINATKAAKSVLNSKVKVNSEAIIEMKNEMNQYLILQKNN